MTCSCGSSGHVACGTVRPGEPLMLITPMEVELSDEETIAELWKVVESRGKLIESLLSLLADRGFEREAKALMGRP